jgi:hypothetical protein
MRTTTWTILVAATIADAVTFCGVSAARVAAAEQNAIARGLGGGLESALVAKALLVLIVVGGCWLLRRYDAPRWLQPAVVLAVSALSLYGAYTNVTYGWA